MYRTEGLSENLLGEIDKWHDRKYEETDRRGGAIKDRVVFQMELAQLYIATDRNNLALDTLEDVLVEADQAGLSDLAEEINNLISSIS
jgi:hypothetical protein